MLRFTELAAQAGAPSAVHGKAQVVLFIYVASAMR